MGTGASASKYARAQQEGIQQLQKIEKQLQQLIEENQRHHLKQSQEEEVDRFKKQLEAEQQTCQQSEEQSCKLASQLKEAEEEQNKLDLQLKSMEKERAELTSQLHQLQNERDNLVAEVAHLNALQALQESSCGIKPPELHRELSAFESEYLAAYSKWQYHMCDDGIIIRHSKHPKVMIQLPCDSFGYFLYSLGDSTKIQFGAQIQSEDTTTQFCHLPDDALDLFYFYGGSNVNNGHWKIIVPAGLGSITVTHSIESEPFSLSLDTNLIKFTTNQGLSRIIWFEATAA